MASLQPLQADCGEVVNTSEEIVFAVLVGDEELEHQTDESVKNLDIEISEPEIITTNETVEAKTRFFRHFLERVFESLDDIDSPINDTAVTCGINCPDVIRVPALLLAAVSPVFKTAGNLTESEYQAVILPDVEAQDFRKDIL